MTKSFFGGDPSKAHWAVSVRFRISKEETEREARERGRLERETLKAADIKATTYFPFSVKDEAGKASQRVKADAEAARITAATGVIVDVFESCFL